MSKRFGRNQKRRMRDALETATHDVQRFNEAYQMADGLLNVVSQRLQQARDWIDVVNDIVGPMSIANSEILTQKDPAPSADSFLVEVRSPIYPSLRSEGTIDDSVLRTSVMHKLKTKVVIDQVRAMKHVHVTLRDGTVAYAINDPAIEMAPKRFLERKITEEISHALVGVLKSQTLRKE
jgi:hypothetical protein